MDRKERLKVRILGAVQGVGFRPFVYRLATEMGLTGWVLNSAQGVSIEAEGVKARLDQFLLRIEKEKPPRSFIQSLEASFLDPVGYPAFAIRYSDGAGEKTTLILPDIAACPDCLREVFDPTNRRHLYPFTNCTNCGPRFTIIEALPYDRPNTTMRKFEMCRECREEYENPLDRRFHAQPNACPVCGPHLELWDETGGVLSTHHWALRSAAEAIRQGRIVAVKGLGGFHLVADARNEEAVIRLRERKHREEKPFALMYPSLALAKRHCEVSDLEERLLLSPESPIVLLRRKTSDHKFPISNFQFPIAPSVAPRNPYLGIMLPYTPLHHILMRQLGFPVIATSGNLSDEPICTDENEALRRLTGIADLFLVHNRPIARHADDSIVRVVMDRELVMRRARGYAPLPVDLKRPLPHILAVGGHLKNTVALTSGNHVFISQHIGDLETPQAFDAFQAVIGSFDRLYEARPELVVCDLHPDYLSTKYAKDQDAPVVEVQHHYAHVAACMAENHLEGRVLGISWDGTGYGPDGTIWGGEFLLVDDHSFRRVASFRRFRLPGGSTAVREPRRTAVGLLYEVFGDDLFQREDLFPLQSFSPSDRIMLQQILAKGINAPLTSSAGRLFDAAASIAGLRQRNSFEGQASMELEFAMDHENGQEKYPFRTDQRGGSVAHEPWIVVDWEGMVLGILDDLKRGIPVGTISMKFHNTMAEIIVQIARRVAHKGIVLTGGCFQNRYLTERAVQRLREEGFHPYWHQRVPPNDGGIALGQVWAAVQIANGNGAPTTVQRAVEETVR
jgi:hydrogenase maturation protein HypF